MYKGEKWEKRRRALEKQGGKGGGKQVEKGGTCPFSPRCPTLPQGLSTPFPQRKHPYHQPSVIFFLMSSMLSLKEGSLSIMPSMRVQAEMAVVWSDLSKREEIFL